MATKAELEQRLAEAHAHFEGQAVETAKWRRYVDDMDSEAKALSAVVKALQPFDNKQTTYSFRDKGSAINRILNAAAARFSVTPDWENIERLVALVRLTDSERQELENLRAAVASVQNVAWRTS